MIRKRMLHNCGILFLGDRGTVLCLLSGGAETDFSGQARETENRSLSP